MNDPLISLTKLSKKYSFVCLKRKCITKQKCAQSKLKTHKELLFLRDPFIRLRVRLIQLMLFEPTLLVIFDF